MKPPAELRMMVAEYALSHNAGLEWYREQQPGGGRAGKFGNKEIGPFHGDSPVSMLSVSRQLRHETAGLLLKVNELHFTDAGAWDFDDDDSNDKEVAFLTRMIRMINPFEYAMNDFKGFLSLADTKTLAAASLCIHCCSNLDSDEPIIIRLLHLT
jgi:hypothetical protein